jgi:hypothetical protein
MAKHVHFMSDRTKVSRTEAMTEILEKPTSGIIHVAVLLIVWGEVHDIPKTLHFVYGLLAMFVIILCILRSLSIVKKLQMEGTAALSLSILQAGMVGLAVSYSQDHAVIVVLSTNLLLAGLPYPYNGLMSRVTAAVIIAVMHPASLPLRIAAPLSVSDVVFLGWKKLLEFKKNRKLESSQTLIRMEFECKDYKSRS